MYCNTYVPTGVAALKKHYISLCMSLPEDHTIAMERLRLIFNNKFVDQIVSSANCQSREIMFNFLISLTKNDNQLLGLSFLIERLATGEVLVSDCPDIESFRNG